MQTWLILVRLIANPFVEELHEIECCGDFNPMERPDLAMRLSWPPIPRRDLWEMVDAVRA